MFTNIPSIFASILLALASSDQIRLFHASSRVERRQALEAYASLRAELLVWPERSDEILPRYHVMNEAARRALEEHWERELAASPEARASFDKALAKYTAWLRSQRG